MLRGTHNRKCWMCTTVLGGALIAVMSGGPTMANDDGHGDNKTATPIKHVIVLIGENRTFDNIYGMYQPHEGQFVANLLSRGIVNSSGDTMLNTKAQQFQIKLPLASATYFIDFHKTPGKSPYQFGSRWRMAQAPIMTRRPATGSMRWGGE
jgi:phospholipase C